MKVRHSDTTKTNNHAILIDHALCIGCNACVRACDAQSVHVYKANNEKFHPPMIDGLTLEKNNTCIGCGQCSKVCPTHAICPTPESLPDKFVALIAPSTRFGFSNNSDTEFKIITALRNLGAQKVYDVNVGADLTTIVDTDEYIEHKEKNELPLFTSCCPGWINFCETFYPDLLPHVSTAESCVQMLANLVKKDGDQFPTIAFMPCTAKKDECKREELNNTVDGVITVYELEHIIKEKQIDLESLPPGEYDIPYAFCTGGAYIFGKSGGVAENVLREVCRRKNCSAKLISAEVLFELKDQKAELYTYDIGEQFKVVVASGGSALKYVCEAVKSHALECDVIEMMACPSGCMNGGGMLKVKTLEHIKVNMEKMDQSSEMKTASENASCELIQELGEPFFQTSFKQRK